MSYGRKEAQRHAQGIPNRRAARSRRSRDSDDNTDDSDNCPVWDDPDRLREEGVIPSAEEALNTVALTGKSISDSYAYYSRILECDKSFRQGNTVDPRITVFIEHTPEQVWVDDVLLARIKRHIEPEYQKAREVMGADLVSNIFGINHDMETFDGRYVYRALTRFNNLATIFEKETVLFSVVAGVVLRQQSLIDSQEVYQEQVLDQEEQTACVWNFFNVPGLQSPHVIPHSCVFAVLLWIAMDPHCFELNVPASYLVLPENPDVYTWETHLRPFVDGDILVNTRLLQQYVSPSPQIPIAKCSIIYGGFNPTDNQAELRALRWFLKPWWRHDLNYEKLLHHVEAYLFTQYLHNDKVNPIKDRLTDEEAAKAMTRKVKRFCSANPLLDSWVPSPALRPDLYDSKDPIMQKYEREQAAIRIRESRMLQSGAIDLSHGIGERERSGTSSSSSAPMNRKVTSLSEAGMLVNPRTEPTTPCTAPTHDPSRELFPTAGQTTYVEELDGRVSFKSREEMDRYMRMTAHKSPQGAAAAVERLPSAPILTVQPKQLRGPDPGAKFEPKIYEQLRPFKDFLEKTGLILNSAEYYTIRNERIDKQWSDHLDLVVFYDEEPHYWKTLDHTEFFRKLFHSFVQGESLDSAQPKGYIEAVEHWIDKEFSKVAHNNLLWTSTWAKDVKEWQKAAQEYLSIRSVTQPSEADLIPGSDAQVILVKRLRKMLFQKAEYHKSQGNAPFMNYLLDIDEEFDKRRVATPAQRFIEPLPIRLPRPTSVDSQHTPAPTVHEYLRMAMVKGKEIDQTIFELASKYSQNMRGVSSRVVNKHLKNKNTPKVIPNKNTSKGSSPNKDRPNKDKPNRDKPNLDRGRKGNPKEVVSEEVDEGEEVEEAEDQEQEEGEDKPRQHKCKGCGKRHPQPCNLGPEGVNHPDWNDTDKKWKESTYGVRWLEKGKFFLLVNKSLKDPRWVNSNDKPGKAGEGKNKKRSFSRNKDQRGDKASNAPKKSKKCKYHLNNLDDNEHSVLETRLTSSKSRWQPTYLCNTITPKSRKQHEYLLTCCISVPNHSHVYDRELECLIDTGALDRNYVSRSVAELLAQAGGRMKACDVDRICSCSQNVCMACIGMVSFDFTFFNELKQAKETLSLEATVIDMDFDIIIGRRDIYKHDLLLKVYRQIFSDLSTSSSEAVSADEKLRNIRRVMTVTTHSDQSFLKDGKSPHAPSQKSIRREMASIPPEIVYLNTSQVKRNITKKEQYLTGYTGVEGDEELFDDEDDDWNPFDRNKPKKECYITGSQSLQTELRKLIGEYKDIFSSTLTEQPALIPPMELKIDDEKWRVRKNCTPHRAVSTKQQHEIKRQVDDMVANKLIRVSEATHYSQVLLTPKPNDQWRFCVDFRNLNDCTKPESWPLPNIKETLNRIGHSGAKVFAVMDLTKGFYQVPMSEAARALTAFICFCGVFEWCRVPMGLKGAPSYFQRMLATVVFCGLIHLIMELYIDDVIVHGPDDIEFIKRLRQVFERLRKYKVTLNPAKCRFGMNQIEYVGHIIDPTGLTFSQDKKDKVKDFPLPVTAKHVRSFIGLANYFRDHIQNHSTIRKKEKWKKGL